MTTQDNKTLRVVGYGILAILSLLGLGAITVRWVEGLMVTNMTQYVTWGLWVALYIYFIGLSAGSFLLSTLIYVFQVKRFEKVGALALFQALVCLLMGLFFIFIDLGHQMRFLNVFIYFQWTSVLAWESLLYLVYAFIILAELYLVLRPEMARKAREANTLQWLYRILAGGQEQPDAKWHMQAQRSLKILGIVGIPIAIGVHGGTGAIFAVVKAHATWYTGIFPIIFLVSALVSGGALLTFLAGVTSKLKQVAKLELVQGLAKLTIGMLAIDLLLEFSEVLVVFYGDIPGHIVGWKYILFGPYWEVFWILEILIGVVIPILLVFRKETGNSIKWLSTAGLLIVIGIIGVRLNIVVPAQIEPSFASLPEVYHHFRFSLGYFPSLNEWLIGIGGISLGIIGFLICLKLFPIVESSEEV